MYERFAKLLEERRITAYKVAKETGIATATLSDWKMGRSVPKIDKLQKIADYFGVSLNYITSNEETSSSENNNNNNPLTGKKMTKKESSQYEKVMGEAALLFDNEDVSEEDKEKLMLALNDIFWKSKQRNKEKYAKSRKK
ncbi:helix-turn-helix domain-containing protein [Cellulosilyticum sp. I15G10I2]|uniref:helix-turn-helix domain-containing protein n=1 Tax=Cellulosilyticum sp. I15G10I2 TaxID=1892843 RepID=UPI00085CDD86|nr:helix-turn-helix transcriptional regulator [Cellulosilyticum sp. I15G10I2]